MNPPLLGMSKVVSEDAVRRGLDKIDADAGATWLQGHLDDTLRPLLPHAVARQTRHAGQTRLTVTSCHGGPVTT